MSRSATYLKKADNGFYYVHWTEDRIGRRVSTRTKDLAAAEAFRAQWTLMEAAPFDALLGEHLTLADVWDFYWKKHVRAKVANQYGADLAWKQMKHFFGDKPASAFDQAIVDDYIERRTSGRLGRRVKPQTVTKELSYLGAAVRFGVRKGLVDPSYSRKLELPEQGEPRDRWLSTCEMQKLLDAASRMRRTKRLSRVERFLWLALETAGRAQALYDLTWDRVDFETRVINLEMPGRRRTKKRRAVVPISSALLPIMQRAYGERVNNRVLDNGARVWASVQLVAIEAGFSDQQKPKTSKKPKATGISPHVLRHTAATHMARRGVPLWVIAKILGNTVAVVEKTYAKHCPDDLRDAVDAISAGRLEAAE